MKNREDKDLTERQEEGRIQIMEEENLNNIKSQTAHVVSTSDMAPLFDSLQHPTDLKTLFQKEYNHTIFQ